MMTRKEFLEEVKKMANLKDLIQADDATQAEISLTNASRHPSSCTQSHGARMSQV